MNLQKLSCSSDEPRVQSQVHLRSAGTKATNSIWSEGQIVSFLKANPNRAYFSRLFRDGGFRSGIEVGVADGRFSEHFLRDLRSISGFQWTMVEPFPNDELVKRYDPHTTRGSWSDEGLLDRVYHSLLKKLSLDKSLLDQLPDEYYDFIYLDGDHSYEGVKAEMPLFWTKVKRGGVLAGHDYCNYGGEVLVGKVGGGILREKCSLSGLWTYINLFPVHVVCPYGRSEDFSDYACTLSYPSHTRTDLFSFF